MPSVIDSSFRAVFFGKNRRVEDYGECNRIKASDLPAIESLRTKTTKDCSESRSFLENPYRLEFLLPDGHGMALPTPVVFKHNWNTQYCSQRKRNIGRGVHVSQLTKRR